MEILMRVAPLIRAVQRVVEITKTKTSLPGVTSNVCVEVSSRAVRVQATDFEISAVVEQEIQGPGESKQVYGSPTPMLFLVNGPMLLSVLTSYPNDECVLDVPAVVSDDMLPPVTIRRAPGDTGRDVTITLPQFARESWPIDNESLRPADGETTFEVPADRLFEGIEQVAYAASKNDDRYELQGVMMRLMGGDMVCCATDGFRMAISRFRTDYTDDRVTPVIVVPARAVRILQGILARTGEAVGNVTVALGEKTIRFSWPGFVLSTRLLNGLFPDYQAVVPKENIPLFVEKSAIISALKRAQVVGGGDAQVTIRFTPTLQTTAGEVTLTVEAVSGTYVETIPANSDQGGEFSVVFNVRFLLDAITRLSAQGTIDILLPRAPSYGAAMVENPVYTGVVMPVRV